MLETNVLSLMPPTRGYEDWTSSFYSSVSLGQSIRGERHQTNPFWHSAVTWNHHFSPAQRRLLFHHFSMVEREIVRRARRSQAKGAAFELHINNKHAEIERYLAEADATVARMFDKRKKRDTVESSSSA